LGVAGTRAHSHDRDPRLELSHFAMEEPEIALTVAATRRGLTGESSWINLDQSRFTRNTHELP